MATLIECPTCKQQVSSNAATCPNCGEIIRKHKCRSVKGGFISLIAGILLCVILCVIGNSNSDGVSVPFCVYLGVLCLIGGIISSCICFTSTMK